MNDLKFTKLPALITDAMLTLKELHNTPEEMSLIIVLAAINAVVAPRYNVDSVVYKIRPTNLFLLCIAGTAAGKTTNFNEIFPPLYEYQEQSKDRLRDEPLRFKLDLKIYAKAEAAYIKDKEEGNIATLPVPVDPIETCEYIKTTATLNGIINVLTSQPYVTLATSEAGTFFGGHSFQNNSDKSTEMASALTAMWDAEPIQRATGESRVNLYNRRVGIGALIQEMMIRSILNNKIFDAQGFLHRFLITQCDDYERPDIVVGPAADQVRNLLKQRLEGFHARIREMLAVRTQLRAARNFELEPVVITIDYAAQELMAQYSNATRDEKSQSGRLRNYAGFCGRLHEHTIRLAANLAAFDNKFTIELAHAEAAVELVDFFVTQRKWLDIGVDERDPTTATQERKLYAWIVTNNWSGVANSLARRGPVWWRQLSVDTRRRLLDSLVEDQLLAATVTVGGNGKDLVTYRVCA